MKINELQINGFGKFSNKKIKFKDGLNIVKGENESGKSTILHFIVDTFYGISQDKRKTDREFEKFEPWDGSDYSGKINYTFNNKKYEVFRDFTKKMPEVYNSNGEDITGDFSKDRSIGSRFFEEQTGLSKEGILSSIISKQGAVVIDQSDENALIQKIANIAETGDERVSYDAAQKYLVAKRTEEIGTDRTKNKPYNLLKNEKEGILKDKLNIEGAKDTEYIYEERISTVEKEISKNSKNLDRLKEIKSALDENLEEQAQISVIEKDVAENLVKEKNLKEEKEKLEEELKDIELINNADGQSRGKGLKSVLILLLILLAIVLIINIIFIKNSIISIVLGSVIALDLLFIAIKTGSESKIKKLSESERQKNIDKIKMALAENNVQYSYLEEKIEDQKEELSTLGQKLEVETGDRITKILGHTEWNVSDFSNISNQIEELQDKIHEQKLEEQKYQIQKSELEPKIEKLAQYIERLKTIEEEEAELDKKSKAIEIASEILAKSYSEMKENVTPQFTEELSASINKISNGKYKKVLANDENGIIIEMDDGKYIPVDNLSIGTIDQMYLSLRLSFASNFEAMPIILDEAFAYYDNKRLENIIKFLNDNYKDRQVILFTCSERETDTLAKLKIPYTLINL